MAWAAGLQEHISDGSVCYSQRVNHLGHTVGILLSVLLHRHPNLQWLLDAGLYHSLYYVASAVFDLRPGRDRRQGHRISPAIPDSAERPGAKLKDLFDLDLEEHLPRVHDYVPWVLAVRGVGGPNRDHHLHLPHHIGTAEHLHRADELQLDRVRKSSAYIHHLHSVHNYAEGPDKRGGDRQGVPGTGGDHRAGGVGADAGDEDGEKEVGPDGEREDHEEHKVREWCGRLGPVWVDDIRANIMEYNIIFVAIQEHSVMIQSMHHSAHDDNQLDNTDTMLLFPIPI